MNTSEYKIEDVDYWENDAFLVLDGNRYYFQFGSEPSIKEALWFLFSEGRIQITE
jgi:hypothetical protein